MVIYWGCSWQKCSNRRQQNSIAPFNDELYSLAFVTLPASNQISSCFAGFFCAFWVQAFFWCRDEWGWWNVPSASPTNVHRPLGSKKKEGTRTLLSMTLYCALGKRQSLCVLNRWTTRLWRRPLRGRWVISEPSALFCCRLSLTFRAHYINSPKCCFGGVIRAFLRTCCFPLL